MDVITKALADIAAQLEHIAKRQQQLTSKYGPELPTNVGEAVGTNWGQYEKYVISKLDDLVSQQQILTAKLDRIDADLSGLKVRTGLLGLVAGGVAGAIPALIALLSRMLH